MKKITLTQSQARAIILHATGLSKRAQFGRGKQAVLKVLDHLGFIQVDTNYVVERAHHHSLAARVPGYKIEWLEELQADAGIYEFWTRDSGFMPIHQFRFSLPIQEAFAAKWKSIPPAEANLMNRILDRIAREGPLSAKDFENDRLTKSSGWWDWRPSKVALERLHLSGRLLATRKKDFHKLYDLTDNIIPSHIDRRMPSADEFCRHIILYTLRSVGVAYANEIAWNGRLVKYPIKAVLEKMVDSGEIYEVQVENLKGRLYTLPSYVKKKIKITGDVFVLSPFDPLNVFRRRLHDFFNFDYQVECFVPKLKRKYGYFCLPVLVGDTFVARMDAKADRKEKKLVILNIHFERVKISKLMVVNLFNSIKEFAVFNKCSTVMIMKSNSKEFLKGFRYMQDL